MSRHRIDLLTHDLLVVLSTSELEATRDYASGWRRTTDAMPTCWSVPCANGSAPGHGPTIAVSGLSSRSMGPRPRRIASNRVRCMSDMLLVSHLIDLVIETKRVGAEPRRSNLAWRAD